VNSLVRGSIASILAGMASLPLSAPAHAHAAYATSRVSQQPIVYVTDNTGRETVGRLRTFDASSITVATPRGDESIDRRHVYVIQRRGDSVASGALAGSIVGAAFGAWFTAQWGCGAMLDPHMPCPATTYAAVMGMMGGIGAGIGIGIDALFRGRTNIYSRANGDAWPSVRVTPAAAGSHASISVSAAW
jgi:hypothetical protein